MMMSDSWYEVAAATDSVTQGDLISDCPVLTWDETPGFEADKPEETLKAARRAVRTDVVVMTQACDLAEEHVTNVTLCPHLALSRYKELWEEDQKTKNQNPTTKSWKKHCDQLKKGFTWNLALLDAVPDGEVRVVDFHHVFTVPVSFLEAYLKAAKVTRLHLLPPYREHLSQAFSRFFMRVGLPTPVTQEW